MLKNLKKTLRDLGISQTFLSENVLGYPYPKYLSIRINGSTEFDSEEKDRIFHFLKEKGYKGDSVFLFEPSEPEELKKKNKPESRFARVINERMIEMKLTNEDLAKRVLVSENTISNWRNGKVKSIGDMDSYIRLCRALNISVGRLMGFDHYVADYTTDGFEFRSMAENRIVDEIYEKMINYQKNVIGYGELDINPIFKQNDLYPLIYEFIANFNTVFEERYAPKMEEKLKLKNYMDFNFLFDKKSKRLNEISKEIQALEKNPSADKELLENKRLEYHKVEEERNKALRRINIISEEEKDGEE